MVRSWTTGRIGHAQISRPEVRNALDIPTVNALRGAFSQLSTQADIRLLVLSGAGDCFSAGGDLKAVRRQSVEETLDLNRSVLEAIAQLQRLAIPSIAAMHGHALGGGLELALGCTLRVASPGARLGFPEPRVGLIPGAGGIARLTRLVGPGVAMRMLLTGDAIDAAEALRIGLIDEIARSDDVLVAAAGLAERIADNGPLAVRAIREVLQARDLVSTEAAIADAEARLPGILASADLREGVAAFSERRRPLFTGT